jgi:hypothetical protein
MTRSRLWLAALLISAAAGPAWAQNPTPPPRDQGSSAAQPRFEIEGYGGLGRFFDAGTASLSLPPAGAPITTSSPMAPSRRVSTWMFGDGAALLNDAMAQLELANRITPLDSIMAEIGRGAANQSSMGARIRYRTAPRVWTELAVDVTSRAVGAPGSLEESAQATRASFVATFNELLASGPFTNRSVSAIAASDAGEWREITTSLAANIELGRSARFMPYLTMGGGWIARTGAQQTISLTGQYSARIAGVVPIDESDRVTVRARASNAPAIIAGAGVTSAAGGRVVFRIDARVITANRSIGATVSADPLVVSASPADYIESFTNPSIQFSNNASTGRQSTLSGGAIVDYPVARSTRLQARGLITFGIGIRF